MTSQSFIKVLDFQDGLIRIYHYEFASNFDLIGKHNSGKPASETSPPSGNIATGLSRFTGPRGNPFALVVPDFSARVIKNDC